MWYAPSFVFMKAIKILSCILLVFILTISCFAESIYNFAYVTSFDSSEYDLLPLDNTWLDDGTFTLYPGVRYYISITIDSGQVVSHDARYRIIDENNNLVFMLVNTSYCLLDGSISQPLTYFDPSYGGNTRTYLLTVSERSTLTLTSDSDYVQVYLFSYDGQGAMIDAGSSIMSIITSYINECLIHWNLLLFCLVLPLIGFAVAVIISFRERRDKN